MRAVTWIGCHIRLLPWLRNEVATELSIIVRAHSSWETFVFRLPPMAPFCSRRPGRPNHRCHCHSRGGSIPLPYGSSGFKPSDLLFQLIDQTLE